ncbi:MAG: hypothetical protein ACI91B_004814 [Planctomycetota bacterium]
MRVQEAGVIEDHAVVKALKGPGFGIKAHGAVRVNGSEVQASPLTDGDVIEIGTTRIAFGKTQERGLPTISGYRIIDVLGKGGMGTVYRAEQVSLHRQVALKVLKQEQTSDPAFIAQFIAEARAAAKLQHPNVVSVFDVEHDGDTYYYAMELMHEGSCEDWLKQNGVMPVDRALQVVADAAAGLAYAESLGIVHRDIKPDNLMLDQHGAVKIADLGLASNASDATGERAIGTPHFMAPEQVLNKELDHRTDLYALGCTFYRLITGKTPFRGQTVKDILRAQVKDQAEPASRANPDVPQEIAAIIQQLMAKDAGDRYQTANDLLEDLERMLQPPQKRGMWIGLAVAAVLIAGGTVWWAVTRPDTIKTIKETVIYDDPEKQQFADRIKVMEGEAKESNATIALLTTRVSGLSDEDLATALERVAANHAGTTAAAEATKLATATRVIVADHALLAAQRRSRIAGHLTSVRQSTIKPLDAYDYERAIRSLDVQPPQDLTDDDELTAGLEKLRGEILVKAREHLQRLREPVTAASTGKDEAKLKVAIDALEQGLKPDTRWPKALLAELTEAKSDATNGQTTLATLQKVRRAGIWQAYHALLQDPQGFRSQLNNCDFTTAAKTVGSFGGDASVNAAALRAKGLSDWTQSADTFAKILEQACATGKMTVPVGTDNLRVLGWDRQKNEIKVRLAGRVRKEETIACSSLLAEQWLKLADQVKGAPAGSLACFVGLLAINKHCHAATTYLGQLNKAGDETGVGDQAYPFAADVFEQLLTRVPNTQENWSKVLSDELLAGKRLAAGLRALSEKRNTAAAGHIEKLFSEHPHSFVVAVLP